MLTNTPATSHTPTAAQDAIAKCHPCATAKPWHDAYTAMSPNPKTSTSLSSSAPGRATSSERKALATMGRRDGQKAPQRWKTDRDGEYAQTARKNLQRANSRRAVKSRVSKRDIANYFERTFIDTGTWPTSAEAMKEFNVSRPTVARALKEAGITLLRRRRTSQK